MSVFFVAKIHIHNESLYQKYLDEVNQVFAKFNGKYLAVDPAPDIIEGSWPAGRVVIIEFPSEQDFRNWYESQEYQAILRYRLMSASCNSVLVRSNKKQR